MQHNESNSQSLANNNNNPIEYNFDNIRIISREEWNARPPTKDLPPLQGPQSTFYSASIQTFWCRNEEDCKKVVNELQKKHMDKGFADIQYNFLIGADGNIYEGVGWHKNVVDFTRIQMNSQPKIIFGCLGRPDESRYLRRMLRTTDRIIEYGVKNKFLKLGNKFNFPPPPW